MFSEGGPGVEGGPKLGRRRTRRAMDFTMEEDEPILGSSDNGRSLSELSIGFGQTMSLLSGAEEQDDGGLGEFTLSLFSNTHDGSRTGSYDAGRSYSSDAGRTGSLSNESVQIQTIRPHADEAGKEAVRALKRKLEESETAARTGSQELADLIAGFDDDLQEPDDKDSDDKVRIPKPEASGLAA
jgi:hypothetical protein